MCGVTFLREVQLQAINFIEGDIGVCVIAVLANFSCGISVILILNYGIAVFSKTYPSLFNEYFLPFLKQPETVLFCHTF